MYQAFVQNGWTRVQEQANCSTVIRTIICWYFSCSTCQCGTGNFRYYMLINHLSHIGRWWWHYYSQGCRAGGHCLSLWGPKQLFETKPWCFLNHNQVGFGPEPNQGMSTALWQEPKHLERIFSSIYRADLTSNELQKTSLGCFIFINAECVVLNLTHTFTNLKKNTIQEWFWS